jgi:hypothetical protein
MKKTYRGYLIEMSNGEEDEIVGLTPDPFRAADREIVAERIESDIDRYGRFLSVRYFVTDKVIPADQVITEWLNMLEGVGRAEYDMHYSDITGYLWTDEELNVGGHDLLNELRSHISKYLHMEIDFR